MEATSIGLLFGCAGVAVVFYGTRRLIDGKGKRLGDTGDYADCAALRDDYRRLFLLRLGCFALSLAAAGIWLLEPKPYAAGILVSVACLLLWRAFRLRNRIVVRLREQGEKMVISGDSASIKLHPDRADEK